MFWLLNIAVARAAEINTNLPGPYDIAKTGPVGFIGNFYYLALGFGGLLAFGSIVYAGIRWTTSQGNPSTISDAKDQIVQALWGLVLLGGAFVILNTINPELTVLQIPQLSEIKASSTPGSGLSQLCSNENPTATCPISFDECKKDASGNYGCRLKDNLIWVCRDESINPDTGETISSVVKYCHRPGNSESGSGKGICNSNCRALIGEDCGAPEQNTGQCRGIAGN